MISVGVVVSWTTWWTVWFIQRYFVVTLDPSLTRYGSLAREYVFKSQSMVCRTCTGGSERGVSVTRLKGKVCVVVCSWQVFLLSSYRIVFCHDS